MSDLTEVLARAAHEADAGTYETLGWFREVAVPAQLAALDAAGYRIVPKEPDEDMIEAAKGVRLACLEGTPPGVVFARAFRAMLAAAPK